MLIAIPIALAFVDDAKCPPAERKRYGSYLIGGYAYERE
jgi:hypothetical protein